MAFSYLCLLLIEPADLAQRTDPKPLGLGSRSEDAVAKLKSQELRSLMPECQSC